MKETGAHAVKLEGGVRSYKQIRRIVQSGIPVMAHIGFTPQSEHDGECSGILNRVGVFEQLLGRVAPALDDVPAES
ncbi:3-methyl-2-oxobutanoate hydroxymethyltransferase, partial [Rhizobium johnstonii]|uniref:3-methyl-2-oxobutanoate hydroxymethyltransferase n=1 Tax=Rhizobium johnstonii TaxID=3019933 RepID=UPI003F9E8015